VLCNKLLEKSLEIDDSQIAVFGGYMTNWLIDILIDSREQFQIDVYQIAYLRMLLEILL